MYLIPLNCTLKIIKMVKKKKKKKPRGKDWERLRAEVKGMTEDKMV